MLLSPLLVMHEQSRQRLSRQLYCAHLKPPLPQRVLHSSVRAVTVSATGRSRLSSFLFGVRVFFRGAWLLLLWGPALLLAPVAYFIPRLRGMHAWIVKHGFAHTGPVAIKLAQWISSRPDLAPADIAHQLMELQYDAPRHARRHRKSFLLLVCPVCNNFWFADGAIAMEGLVVDYSHCVGSGSVAQVYRGSANGRSVAVKILHPGVRTAVEVDLALLRFGVWLIGKVMPSYRYMDLAAGLAEFSKEVRSQLDLGLEYKNLARFRELFKHDAEVTFPEPLFVSRDVLVMEFVEGQLMSDLLLQEAKTKQEVAFRKHLASVGLNAFFHMLKNNLVHGDLHAGNIIVTHNAAAKNVPPVHLIDVGIVVELAEQQRENFWVLFSAVVRRDGESAATEMMNRGGRVPGVTDEAGFRTDMAEIFRNLPVSFKSAPLAHALVDVLESARRNRVLLDSSFVTLISSCIVLEGTGRKLDPDLSLFQLAVHMVKESTKRRH